MPVRDTKYMRNCNISVLDNGLVSLKSQTLCWTFSIVNTVKKLQLFGRRFFRLQVTEEVSSETL
jgi:hypothetical protein